MNRATALAGAFSIFSLGAWYVVLWPVVTRPCESVGAVCRTAPFPGITLAMAVLVGLAALSVSGLSYGVVRYVR